MVPLDVRDEPSLVAALLSGVPALSRNRHFDLLSSDIGKRARRRANFLRSIARDIETTRRTKGSVTIERGRYARGEVRLVIHALEFVRRAYLTTDEVTLLGRVFPFVARVIDPHSHD